APYLAHAQVRGYQASLTWISRKQVALERIVAEDTESEARKVVALRAGLLAEERRRPADQEALHRAAPPPMPKREVKRMRGTGEQPELPLLTEVVTLPTEWDILFTREQLSAVLVFLESPARSRDPKAIVVQRVGERLEAGQTTRAQFFEVFKRELAV